MPKEPIAYQFIRRIETSQQFLRIYLSMKRSGLKKFKLFVVFFNRDSPTRNLLQGVLLKKSSPFPLIHEETQETIQAEFHGNRHGGEVLIPLESLPSISKLFVKVEKALGHFDESSWIYPSVPHKAPSKTVAVIPCYNVEKYCQEIVEETAKLVDHVIAVDDGSTDGTGAILRTLANHVPEKIHLVVHPKNAGKGSALISGFRYALSHIDFDALVTIDADAQHRPSDVAYLAEQIKEGAELVIGARLYELMPFRSRFANRIIAFLLQCKYPDAPLDTQSGMRGFSKNFVEEIISKISGGHYEMEFQCLLLALEQQRKIKSVPISTIYFNKNVSSHFSPFKDSLKILKVFLRRVFFGKITLV
jgi:hypothetical protein